MDPFFDPGFQALLNPPSGQRVQLGKLKEYRYTYTANSFLFEAAAHLLCICSSAQVGPPISTGLLSVLGLLFQVYELLERRRQSLPLLNPESAELIDIALEGSSSSGPRPTIPELEGVFDKLTELKLKLAKEKAKQASGRGRNNSSRGRGRHNKGKDPAE